MPFHLKMKWHENQKLSEINTSSLPTSLPLPHPPILPEQKDFLAFTKQKASKEFLQDPSQLHTESVFVIWKNSSD